MKAFLYFEPGSINEASDMLAKWGRQSIVMAGGTDIVPQMKRGVVGPEAIVSLGRISELQEIQ